MSIAIVSSLPQGASGSLSEGVSAEGGAALDFAGLLFSQMLPPISPGKDTLTQEIIPQEAGSDQDMLAAAAFVVPFLALAEESISLAETASRFTSAEQIPTDEKASGLADFSGKSRYGDMQQATDIDLAQNGRKTNALATPSADTGEASAKFAVKADIQASGNESPAAARTASSEAAQPVAVLAADQRASTEAVRQTSVTLSIPGTLKDAAWDNDFGQKIIWMAHNNKQSAQIVLNPPELGKIEVSLNIDKANATATFVSASADVRESLENALPRLREMFADIGIELGQANVSHESHREQADTNGQGNSARPTENEDGAILESASATGGHLKQLAKHGEGMVDTFV